MDYLLLKWLHIISSTVLFGTGIGSAFYMLMANRSGNVSHIYFAARHVVIADWIFTAPAAIVQLITGIILAKMSGYHLSEGWVLLALVLYVFAIGCWLPVIVIQIQMRDIAKHAHDRAAALPPPYRTLEKRWIWLGSLAFPAFIAIFYLMVFKPGF